MGKKIAIVLGTAAFAVGLSLAVSRGLAATSTGVTATESTGHEAVGSTETAVPLAKEPETSQQVVQLPLDQTAVFDQEEAGKTNVSEASSTPALVEETDGDPLVAGEVEGTEEASVLAKSESGTGTVEQPEVLELTKAEPEAPMQSAARLDSSPNLTSGAVGSYNVSLYSTVSSATAYNGVTTYLKAALPEGIQVPAGYRYNFYLTLNGKLHYLTSNLSGALNYRLTEPGDYIFEATLSDGNTVLTRDKIIIPVLHNPFREETRLGSVWSNRVVLEKGGQPAYLVAHIEPSHRIIQRYDFYETDLTGKVLRWIYGHSGNGVYYTPSETGQFKILVEGVDSMGQHFSGLGSSVYTVSYKDLSIDYLVTDARNNILDRDKTTYIKAGVKNETNDELTYSFFMISKKTGQSFFLNRNNHGNLYEKLSQLPVGSYDLKVLVEAPGNKKISSQIPVSVTSADFKLDFFVATPAVLKDSSIKQFYLKAKATTQIGHVYSFYSIVGGRLGRLLYTNEHGNLLYTPDLNGSQGVRVCVVSVKGDEVYADRSINYLADPPVLSKLILSKNSVKLNAREAVTLRTTSNMESGKNYTFSYSVRDGGGRLYYLTSNREGFLVYNPTRVGLHTLIVTLSDQRHRQSTRNISFMVTSGRRVIYLSPSNQPANMYKGIPTSEREQMELVASLVKQELTGFDVDVILPDYAAEDRLGWRKVGPNNDNAIRGSGRPSLAADMNADFYLAIHSNALGRTNNGVTGPLALYHPDSQLSFQTASALVKNALAIAPLGSTTTTLHNGMAAFGGYGYAEIREPMKKGIPSVLFEVEFHDYAKTAQWIVNNKRAIAKSIAKSLVESLGLQKVTPAPVPAPRPNPTGEIFILGAPTATESQMKSWAQSKRAAAWFIQEIPTFYSLSIAAGVDPSVTYAQAALETGYGRFGGVVDASFHNPCGLKTSLGGGDYDRSAHTRFDSWTTGILAQVDHLALYAGQAGYPKPMNKSSNYGVVTTRPGYTSDPRHFPYLFGTAKTVKALGAKWAPSSSYGNRVSGFIREIWRH